MVDVNAIMVEDLLCLQYQGRSSCLDSENLRYLIDIVCGCSSRVDILEPQNFLQICSFSFKHLLNYLPAPFPVHICLLKKASSSLVDGKLLIHL